MAKNSREGYTLLREVVHEDEHLTTDRKLGLQQLLVSELGYTTSEAMRIINDFDSRRRQILID